MKRIAPILLFGILACYSTDRVTPTMPAAESRLSDGPVSIDVELFSDEFCKGGNVWWSARFNVFFAPELDKGEIRVYTIDAFGERKFFGVARSGVPELEGFDYEFYADGIAPPDSIPDNRGAGYPPNEGFAPFGFDIYVGPKHQLVATTIAYSDITLKSNLFPHACKDLAPNLKTGGDRSTLASGF